MAGRIPKPQAQRTRTNKTMGEKLPKEGSGFDPPEYEGLEEMSLFAQKYWARIWASPMALVYLDADIPALIRLTEMINVWHILKEPGVLAEIRQLEDRFGLSPLSRRRLEWEIIQSGAEPEAPEAPAAEDERWLRAV